MQSYSFPDIITILFLISVTAILIIILILSMDFYASGHMVQGINGLLWDGGVSSIPSSDLSATNLSYLSPGSQIGVVLRQLRILEYKVIVKQNFGYLPEGWTEHWHVHFSKLLE